VPQSADPAAAYSQLCHAVEPVHSMSREDWAELVQQTGSDLYKDRRTMWQTSPRLQTTDRPDVWVLVPALEMTPNGTRSPIHVIATLESFL
jgi:hypothetical protein